MKKTAKKALSLFLCAVLCLSLLPVSAFAENEEAAEEVLTAEELPESGAEPIAEEPAEDPAAETVTTDDAVAIASGTCGENLTWTLDDAGLLTISGTGDMTNYSLCEAPWWENYCDVILSVVIESGVTGIGDCAFQDCRNMKSISIPEGVTRIGDYALASFDLGNSSLTEIRFPDSLTSIGKQAIYGCKAITEIRIPDGVVSIGGQFTQCDALKTISIPSSTVDIGAYLVMRCPNLTEVLVDEGNTAYTSVDGVLFSKDLKKLICFPAGKAEEYTVSEGVESIGKYAFDFSGVRKVVLPGSVVSIGEYAFNNCSSLSDITLKSGITSIGDSAFYRCSSLTGITIPDTVTEISGYAFQDCSSLTEIRFTGDAPAIGAMAFYNVTATAYYPAGNETWTEEAMQDYGGTITWVEAPASTILYSGTCGESLTWVLDSEGTLTISGTGAMEDYSLGGAPWYDYRTGVISLVIESGVTSIGDYAFDSCSGLTSAVIPEGVTGIGYSSFFGCSGLTGITIPGSTASISASAFQNCMNLTEILVKEENSAYTSLDGILFNRDKTELICCPAGKAAGEYIVPDTVVSIGTYAFYRCSGLTGITIPDATTSIEADTFQGCTALATIQVGENNPVFTSVDGVLFNADRTQLVRYPAGKTEDQYTIPDSVTGIGIQAFSYCSSLTGVTIPGSVSEINWYAFYQCSSLADITIPASVRTIDIYAFRGCTGLTEITFKGDAPSIEASSFTNVTATAYYPAGNETWTEELMQDYGGSLTWTAYDPGLPIDESIFPDAAFREYVTGFDSDGDGYFSAEELNAVTDISCNSKGIRDLTGIENFSRLRTLNCEWNYLENVDLSANTALEEVSLCANQLLSLNVSGLTALTSLNVGFYGYAFDDNGDPILDGPNVNKLTALDVSTNTALETLNCDANSLAALDVSGNNALTSLSCTDNKLEQLDLSANTGLLTLWVSGNPIETLDVSANTQLDYLVCNETPISSLDLHANTALTGLECVDCERLTGLDLSANTELTSLVTFWSKIERLDVSANTKLETLNCSEGNLEQIVGLSRLTNLSMLFCNVNHLTALDLSFFADKESFMFDCGGQTALVSAGAGLLADGSCRVNIADLVGAENTAKVSGVTALTRADGETPELISYDEATGAAVFTAAPESIVYNYDVGCNGKKMDVTAPVSLAAGYTLTGTAISWDGEGNEVICLYSGMT